MYIYIYIYTYSIIMYIYMYAYVYADFIKFTIYFIMYILLIALAYFCVRGHSYPGSIYRIPGTIYRIPGTTYGIPGAIYCIILILVLFISKLLDLFKKTHSEAKAVTKPSVYNNSTLVGFGQVLQGNPTFGGLLLSMLPIKTTRNNG